MVKDKTNTKCPCGGTYKECSQYDDYDGKLTCTKCKTRINRYA